MDDVVIALATMDDFEEVQQLFRKMFDLFCEHHNPEYPFTEGGKAYLRNRIEQQWAYVAKHDGCTIGFLTGSVESVPDFKTYRECGFIQNMYVLEAFRKQGIGRLLAEAFIARCRRAGIRFIQTDSDANQALMNFYTEMGFKICGIKYIMALTGEVDEAES